MTLIWESLREALQLIFSGDPVVFGAALRSLWISGLAVGVAAMIGLPLGTMLARLRLPGRQFLVLLFRAAMAVPTVFIGLVCFALFDRRGPLGPIEWLYTPWVIVVGEFALALPLVVSISHGAVKSLDPCVGRHDG